MNFSLIHSLFVSYRLKTTQFKTIVVLFLLGCLNNQLLAQNATLVVPTSHTGKVQSIVVDRQNKYFYTRDEFKIIMWDVKTMRQLLTFNYSNKVLARDGLDGLKSLRLERPTVSGDGKTIALTTLQDTLKVYSTVTGKLMASVPSVFTAPAFSADSKTIYFVGLTSNINKPVGKRSIVKAIELGSGTVKDYMDLPELEGDFSDGKYFYPLIDGRIINFYQRKYEVFDLDAKKIVLSTDLPESTKQKLREPERPLDKFNFQLFPETGLMSFQVSVGESGIAQIGWDIYANKEFSFTQYDLQLNMQESFREGNLFFLARSNAYRKQEAVILGKGGVVEKKVLFNYANEIELAALINKKNTLIYFAENNQLFKVDLNNNKKMAVSRGLPVIVQPTITRNGNLLSFTGSNYLSEANASGSYRTHQSFYTVDLERAAITLQDTMPSKLKTTVAPLKLSNDNYMLQYKPIGSGLPDKFFFYSKSKGSFTPFAANDFDVQLLKKEYNAFAGTPEMFTLNTPGVIYYTAGDFDKKKVNRYDYHLYKYNLTTKIAQKIISATVREQESGKDWYDPFIERPRATKQVVLDQKSGLLAIAENNFKGTLKVFDLKTEKVIASLPFAYDSTGFLENQKIPDRDSFARRFKPHPFLIHQAKKTKDNLFRIMGNEVIYEFELSTGKVTTKKFTDYTQFYPFNNVKFHSNNNLDAILVSYADDKGTVVKTIYGAHTFQLSHITSPVKDIQFTENDSTLYTINEDQTMNAYNAITGAFYGTLYSFENSADWVFVGADGRFDGTNNGMKRLYYVQDREIINLDKIYERYYTPNLFVRLVAGENFAPVPPIRFKPKPINQIIYAEKQRNLEVVDENVIYANTTGIAEITVKATAPEDKVDEIRLFHNGKVATITTRNLTVTDNDGVETKKYTINLLPGRNIFNAISLNSQRTESDADEITVNYTANGVPTPAPKTNTNAITGPIDLIDKDATLHLMVIGINTYTNKINPLTYALPDATAFKDEVEKDAKSMLANVKTYFFSDAKANNADIKTALNEIKQNAKPKDVFIFYFAGHGYIYPDTKEFYLVSADVTDADQSLLKNGIAAKELQEYAVDILAQKQVFILDACQSAGAYEKMMRHDGEQQKSLAVVSRSTGTHWIAASGSTETAKEFAQLGHGAFTYVLLQALKGEASKNKMITVNGLKNFLQLRVPELVKKYGGNSQLPSSYGLGNDFPVEVLK